jgi:hypothetical protein
MYPNEKMGDEDRCPSWTPRIIFKSYTTENAIFVNIIQKMKVIRSRSIVDAQNDKQQAKQYIADN